MTDNEVKLSYADTTGKEYTETATSPGMAAIREEELHVAGYTVK